MARFKILSKDGATTRYEGKPRYIGSYLRPSYLEFGEIASDKPIAWEVGDYVEYSRTGMRYYLYSIPQVSKNARSGSHGKAFSYSNVQFHAASKDLEIAPFRDIVPGDNGVHFSSSPEVATFEDVYGIARRIQACMDEIYPGKWQILVTSFDSVEDAEIYDLLHTPKNFALSGGTCLDALSKIYELWGETGWYHFYYSVSGMNVIMIGYSSRAVGSNTVGGFYYGKGKGLTAIKKTQINKDELATRLYVYGSERNLPLRWYNGLNIANAESVDIRNLMLPLDRWGKTNGLPDARKAYLENAEAVEKYGIIPKSHYFDSDDAGADLYPTIEGMTVGMVRKALADMGESKYVPSSRYSDSERVDEVFASSPTVDNGVLKKNGAEHNYTEGFTYAGATTPMVTIAKGTDEETAIVENYLLYQSDVALDKVYRAKVTASADLACRVPDKGFSIVRGELRLGSALDGTEPKGKMDVFFHLDEEKGEWVLDIPNISADYVDASYLRYQIYLALSVYVTPKEALSSAVTTNMTISEGGIDIIIDQIFDKTFSLSLKQIGFNIAERAALGEGKVISMKSGMCEGRNFVIKTCRFVESNDTWRIECARQKDDNLGMLFPNTDYQIKAGDRFVLLDIAMPDTYIYANMERVYTEGMKLLEKASKVQYHYEPVIDAKVMAESEKTIREGMFLEFVDDDIIDTAFVRLVIDSLNIYEDESAIPTYRVTLKEKKKVSYKGTPSATSETKTSSYGDEGADGGSVDIDLTDYATREWVREQKYTTEEWTNKQGFLKSIEGSDFVEYKDGKVSLILDEQGGLGERGQGLGIVNVPHDALNGSLKTINGESLVGTGNINIQGGIAYESDPIFKASPAAKITDEDIERWNEVGDVVVDSSMSDTSENAVQNKVIKKYVDSLEASVNQTFEGIETSIEQLDSAVSELIATKQDVLVSGTTIKTINGESILGEGDIEIQGGNGGGAEVRTLFVNDAGLSADELSYNAETVQMIFAQHPMIFFASSEEGTPLSEYELMGMDNGRMVFARYELNEYSTGATYIYLAMDGSTEVGGFSKSELDGDKYDSSLDADSVNAVQNKVVTENIRALEATMPLMAAIDLDTIIAQDTPIDNATRNALLELGGYTEGDKYFSKGWIWSRGYLYTIKVIPTDAGVQIHVLSLKGWCEILEDNSKVNHLPSQGGGSIDVDAELSETSENAVSNKAVTMALAETEEVTAAALNELNERFEEYATKEDLEDALADVSIEVDSAMSDTSENAVSNKTIKKYVDDADNAVKEYVDDADNAVKEYVDDADNALAERISVLEQNSGGGNVEVDAELSESSTNAVANKAVTEAIVEDEEVISVALNQMNTRFDGYVPLDALATEIQNAKDVIDASIIDNEEVAAAALVDLDKRLKDILMILGNAGLIS